MDSFTPDYLLRLVLRTSRTTAGLTQKQAAAIAGCDPSWWKKTESGRARVNVDTFARMARAAQVNPDQLDHLRQPDIASLVRMLETREVVTLNADRAEECLACLPGTTTSERQALVLYLRRLRAGVN